MNIETFIKFNEIEHIYVSKSISKDNLNLNIEIIEYNQVNDISKNVIFCGLYTYKDYDIFKKHKGKKWILWCGNDINFNYDTSYNYLKLKRVKKILSLENDNIQEHLALNNKCYYNLQLLGIECKTVFNSDIEKIELTIKIPKNINYILILLLINNPNKNVKFNVSNLFFSNKVNKVNLLANSLWKINDNVYYKYDSNDCVSIKCNQDHGTPGIKYKNSICVNPDDEYFFSLTGCTNMEGANISPVFISNEGEIFYTYDNQHLSTLHSNHNYLPYNNIPFDFNKINQIHISDRLLCYKKSIYKKFNFKEITDYNNNEDMIFFGLYDKDDLKKINNHKGNKYLIWDGDDTLFKNKDNLNNLKELSNYKLTHISISGDIENRLQKWKVKSIRKDFNFVDTTLFKPTKKVGYKIYIYNGESKGSEELYGSNIYEQLVSGLRDYDFIFSNEINIPKNEMYKVYSECFIAMRFSRTEGNLNMSHELEAMNIPYIHNFSDYGLKFLHMSDITNYIKEYNPFKYVHKDYLINNDNLDNFNDNIDEFSKLISEYKNILFLCGDYPGYGGAATNCNALQEFYSKDHNTYGIYYNFTDSKCIEYNSYCIINKSDLINIISNLKFNPDLIILKSFVNIDLRTYFKCPIFYCIGGIYKNNLEKYHYELTTNENNLFANTSVLNQIKNVDKAFSNSKFTQELLKKKFNIDTLLFYSGFIPYYKKIINFDKAEFQKREYDYGLIMSDFNRPIKNADKSINILKKFNKKTILIGNNSNKYEHLGFTCKELVNHDNISNYLKKIKFIQQDSFYESFSNLKIESIFNGCKFNKNIVVSSTQYPGYGGAATNAYAIIKYLRHLGYNTVGLFFHTEFVNNYDPDNIGGIYLFSREYDDFHVKNLATKYLGSLPDICIAKNYIAPIYCKNIFNCYTIYLVSGINHFYLYYDNITAEEFLDEKFIVDKNIDLEIECNKQSDLIVFNSELSKKLYMKIYPSSINKIYKDILDTTSITSFDKPEYTNNKEYDILICCSNLERVDKNNMFFIEILNKGIFNKYKKCIIGSNFKKFEDIPNSTCLGLLEQKECVNYMNKSKLLLFPSYFDANSNTVRESYYNKCLPLITQNIGFSELFPEFLICNNFNLDEWEKKILYIIGNYEILKDTKINFQTECHNFNELINNTFD